MLVYWSFPFICGFDSHFWSLPSSSFSSISWTLSPPRLPFLVLIRHKYSNTATSFLSPPHLHSPLLVQVGAVSLIPRMIELLASAHLFCKYKSTLGRITSPPIINNTRCFSSVIPIVLVQIISLALVRWSSNL